MECYVQANNGAVMGEKEKQKTDKTGSNKKESQLLGFSFHQIAALVMKEVRKTTLAVFTFSPLLDGALMFSNRILNEIVV